MHEDWEHAKNIAAIVTAAPRVAGIATSDKLEIIIRRASEILSAKYSPQRAAECAERLLQIRTRFEKATAVRSQSEGHETPEIRASQSILETARKAIEDDPMKVFDATATARACDILDFCEPYISGAQLEQPNSILTVFRNSSDEVFRNACASTYACLMQSINVNAAFKSLPEILPPVNNVLSAGRVLIPREYYDFPDEKEVVRTHAEIVRIVEGRSRDGRRYLQQHPQRHPRKTHGTGAEERATIPQPPTVQVVPSVVEAPPQFTHALTAKEFSKAQVSALTRVRDALRRVFGMDAVLSGTAVHEGVDASISGILKPDADPAVNIIALFVHATRSPEAVPDTLQGGHAGHISMLDHVHQTVFRQLSDMKIRTTEDVRKQDKERVDFYARLLYAVHKIVNDHGVTQQMSAPWQAYSTQIVREGDKKKDWGSGVEHSKVVPMLATILREFPHNSNVHEYVSRLIVQSSVTETQFEQLKTLADKVKASRGRLSHVSGVEASEANTVEDLVHALQKEVDRSIIQDTLSSRTRRERSESSTARLEKHRQIADDVLAPHEEKLDFANVSEDVRVILTRSRDMLHTPYADMLWETLRHVCRNTERTTTATRLAMAYVFETFVNSQIVSLRFERASSIHMLVSAAETCRLVAKDAPSHRETPVRSELLSAITRDTEDLRPRDFNERRLLSQARGESIHPASGFVEDSGEIDSSEVHRATAEDILVAQRTRTAYRTLLESIVRLRGAAEEAAADSEDVGDITMADIFPDAFKDPDNPPPLSPLAVRRHREARSLKEDLERLAPLMDRSVAEERAFSFPVYKPRSELAGGGSDAAEAEALTDAACNFHRLVRSVRALGVLSPDERLSMAVAAVRLAETIIPRADHFVTITQGPNLSHWRKVSVECRQRLREVCAGLGVEPIRIDHMDAALRKITEERGNMEAVAEYGEFTKHAIFNTVYEGLSDLSDMAATGGS